MPQPKPVKIAYRKDGGWYTWDRHIAGRNDPGGSIGEYNKGDNDRFAAVQFEDGSIFDAVSGWQAAEAPATGVSNPFDSSAGNHHLADK